jgi:probable rRNA maturation factor
MNEIDVQYAVAQTASLPNSQQLCSWAQAVLDRHQSNGSLSIRITDETEITELNREYRHQDKPTNVLSFPMDLPEDLGISMLGDIAICAPVVEKEATEQNKLLDSHWAHMVIHGTLHLLGYDHINDDEAEEMESLEIEIMQGLGYKNPYQQMED